MPTKLTGVALALSLAALAVAAYAVLRDRPDPAAADERLDELQARLAALERAEADRAREREDEPTLIGLGLDLPSARSEGGTGSVAGIAGTGGTGETASTTSEEGASPERIRELVDEAVAKKAVQLQQMRDKKPPIEAFARTLALTEAQRETVEREVVRAQHEIRALLETPAADGTVFLDELVEVLAEGMARPGEKSGRGMKLFGRLLTEEVPGTSQTYAVRAEAVKDTVRAAFRRELTESQYALFEAWQMDPTEIREVEGSPWKDLERRVLDRARDLGADVPD